MKETHKKEFDRIVLKSKKRFFKRFFSKKKNLKEILYNTLESNVRLYGKMNLFLYNFHESIKKIKNRKRNEADQKLINTAYISSLKMYAHIDAIGEEIITLSEAI